jgi:hypothetical protein
MRGLTLIGAASALFVAGIVGMTAAPVVASNETTKTYYLPTGDLPTGHGYLGSANTTGDCRTKDPGVGGACFAVNGLATLDVKIQDQSGQTTSAFLTFYDDIGNTTLGYFPVCGTALNVTVPHKSARLEVHVGTTGRDGATGLKTACPTPSLATTGTITVIGGATDSTDALVARAGPISRNARPSFGPHSNAHLTSKGHLARGMRAL